MSHVGLDPYSKDLVRFKLRKLSSILTSDHNPALLPILILFITADEPFKHPSWPQNLASFRIPTRDAMVQTQDAGWSLKWDPCLDTTKRASFNRKGSCCREWCWHVQASGFEVSRALFLDLPTSAKPYPPYRRSGSRSLCACRSARINLLQKPLAVAESGS